jgi:hypothetical protein
MSEATETSNSQQPPATPNPTESSGAPAQPQQPGQPAEPQNTLLGEGANGETPSEFTPFDPNSFEFPEGLEVTDELKTTLADLSSKHKVSGEAMADLVKMHHEMVSQTADKLSREVEETWGNTLNEWKGQVTQHYGDNLQTVMGKCGKVLDEYGTPELRQALDMTGLGNHPELFKFIERVADAVGEATPVPASGDPAPARTQGYESLYPSMIKDGS